MGRHLNSIRKALATCVTGLSLTLLIHLLCTQNMRHLSVPLIAFVILNGTIIGFSYIFYLTLKKSFIRTQEHLIITWYLLPSVLILLLILLVTLILSGSRVLSSYQNGLFLLLAISLVWLGISHLIWLRKIKPKSRT
jgi:hypothetical protein